MKYNCIYQVYIADGFNDDCERLIDRCLKAGKVTYEVFCELWKEMGFDTLFRGRLSGAEIAELSEELVHTAKQHMLSNTGKFEASVAGLFIVYALLNLQPYRGFAALRLVPEDIPAVTRLQEKARRARRLDVLYILGAVLIQNTQYHAAERERGMESTYRKYLEGYLNIDNSSIRPYGVFSHRTEELDLLQDITRINAQYADFKTSFSSKVNTKNLNYVNHNLSTELDASLRNVIGGFMNDLTEKEETVKKSSEKYQKSTVQEIKERAMKLSVGKIKHLTGINERENITQSDTNKKMEIKTKSGKIKTSSPTKPATPCKKRPASSLSSSKPSRSTSKSSPNTSKSSPSTSKSSPSTSKLSPNASKSPRGKKTSVSRATTNTFRKRKRTQVPNRKYIKARRKVISESDTESDDSNELNLDDSDELVIEVPPKIDQYVNQLDNQQEIETNIQIDSLPSFMRSEQDGKTFEIEIIDELNKAADQPSKDDEMIVDQSKSDDSNNDKKIKLPSDVRLKKVEKRDMKKSTLKSKFKRMGILPIANFNEK